LVRPRVIACLGAVAWRELAGKKAPFEPQGAKALVSGTSLVYPVYHPGYVIRGAYSEQAYARDFVRLQRLLRSLAANARVKRADGAPRRSVNGNKSSDEPLVFGARGEHAPRTQYAFDGAGKLNQ
jgi:hypothetical protein